MVKLCDDLRKEFDYVLLDCPAGIEQGFKNAIAGADRALVVTTPEVSAIRDADRIIVLDEGKMVGQGTHKELMKTCAVYQEIAYSQLSKEELENE